MPPKRKYNKARRGLKKKYNASVPALNKAAKTIQAAVKRAITRHMETKTANTSSTDYIQIQHNSFITLDNTVLFTEQGVTDPTTNGNYCRIGDEISLQSIHFKMMIELNERYSDTTYRIMLIRSARGDIPTITTLWNGLSGNKMLDTFNKERYTIMFQKVGKIRAPPQSVGRGAAADDTVPQPSTGIYYSDAARNFLSRSTKIIKFTIPGKKFARNGIIKYDSGGSTQKFFDYNLVVYAYANYNTLAPTGLTAGYNVMAVNDYIKIMYFKDA